MRPWIHRFAWLVFFGLAAPAAGDPPAGSQAPALLRIWGHYDLLAQGTVAGLLYAPDGRQLLALQDDRSVRAWYLVEGMPLGHWPARSLCLNAAGGFTGGDQCPPQPCEITSPAALMPDGHSLVTATEVGISVCDLRGRGQTSDFSSGAAEDLEHVPPAVEVVAATPDGRHVVVGSDDGALTAYDISGAHRRIPVHGAPVMALGFSADGATVLSAALDGSISWTQLATGKRLRSLQVAPRPARRPSCDTPNVEAVTFSPDGERALVATRAGLANAECIADRARVRLWDLGRRKVLWEIQGSPVRAAAFAPAGNEIALATPVHPEDRDEPRPMEIVRVDARTGLPTDVASLGNDPVTALQFSVDGAQAASGDASGVVRLWQSRTGRQIAQTALHAGAVTALAFSPNQQGLLVQSEDDGTRLLGAQDGRPLRMLVRPPPTLRAGPHCPTLASEGAEPPPAVPKLGGLERPRLPVHDPADLVEDLVLPQEAVWLDDREILSPQAVESCVSYGNDCEIGCERSYSLVRIAAPTAKVLQHFPDLDEELLARCNTRADLILTQATNGGVHGFAPDGSLALAFAQELGKVTACSATPDGRRLLLATSSSLSLWDGRSFKQLLYLPRYGKKGGDVALSPDGSVAVEVNGSQVRVIHLPEGAITQTLPLGFYEDFPTAIAFSPTGDSFLIGTARGVVLQFSLASRTARR